jgi:glycosyltransferase involved in cell wall biosynthesis
VPEAPLVSIVTPTLQRADLLERTLRSVRAQTHSCVEHVVVDGGSTDGTLELLERHAGTYNLRWISEPDRGMYDAINKGLRMATGEILGYLNSDDLHFPWTVEAAVEAFANHPGADAIYGDIIRMDEIGQRVVPVFVPPFDRRAMAAYGTLSQPAVLLRRRVIDELGGFDDTLRYVADLEFWLRAGDRFRFVRIPEILALEQRHAGMLSETRQHGMAIEDARLRDAYRLGLGATAISRSAAYVRWHGWSGRSWVEFVRAVRRRKGGGWQRAIAALRPSVGVRTAVLGVLPSKGSRLRGGVRWGADPLAVASAAVEGSERED